jgi:hypothetical protein
MALRKKKIVKGKIKMGQQINKGDNIQQERQDEVKI